MALSLKTLCAALAACILFFCSSAMSQDFENDPAIQKAQQLFETVKNGMEPYKGLSQEYTLFLESMKERGLSAHEQAMEHYLPDMALAGRSEYMLGILQEKAGGANHAHDLRAVFSPGAHRDRLADPDSINKAINACNAFMTPNGNRPYISFFFAELEFQMYYAYAQAGFEKALETFNRDVPALETYLASDTSQNRSYAAAILIVLSVELGQNTRAVAYYEKYGKLLEQIQAPEILEWPYQALVFAYTVTGDKVGADAMRAKIAALFGEQSANGLDGLQEGVTAKMVEESAEMYMYMESDEMEGGSGSSAAPAVAAPPEIITSLKIANITRVQADQLIDAFWGLPDFLYASVEQFDQNTAVLRIITSQSQAGEIAAFLNSTEFPGFVVRAQTQGTDAIDAQALGIAKQQFSALVPVFDYVADPEPGEDSARAIEYIGAMRAALPADAPADAYRNLLLDAGEAVLQNNAENEQFFKTAPGAPEGAMSAFPDLAILLYGTYGLAMARVARHGDALMFFSQVHKHKDRAAADIVQPLIHRSMANEIAMGVQVAVSPMEDAEKASAALDALKTQLVAEGEVLKLMIVQAGLHYKSGDYEKSAQLYSDVEREAARFTNLHGVAAYALLGRGNCAIMMRRHADAADAYAQAADRAGTAQNMLLESMAQAHLARVLLFEGKYADAQTAAQSAVQIADRFALSSLTWQARYSLARALEAQSSLEPALEQYGLAMDALDAAGSVPEELGADGEDVYRYAVALCAHMGRQETAMQIIERGRAHALKIEFQKSTVAFHDEDKQRSARKLDEYKQKMTQLESQLESAAAAPPDDKAQQSASDLKKSLQDTQREYIKYVTELERTHPELASLYKIEPLDLVKIRRELPGDMAVISYVIGDNALYIFLVRADRLVFRESPVDGDTLTTQIKLMRSIISNPRNADADSAARLENFRRGAGRLYDILFKPIVQDLEGVSIVAILPNGILNFVPFQALVPTDGTADYLVRKYSLFYLDTLAAISNSAPGSTGPDTPLFAFGNADETLPAAEREVDALKVLYPAASVYLRRNATESQAKSLSESPGIFHFATHGILDFKDISQSYITLAPDAGEDGRFTIEEVWGYWWGDSALVALSACSTALGELTVRGKAVNPAGAFLNAGAPAVLASLWNVDDTATAELMRAFYANLATMKKADALRAAQIAMLDNPAVSHPYYWAPFMLIGDWR